MNDDSWGYVVDVGDELLDEIPLHRESLMDMTSILFWSAVVQDLGLCQWHPGLHLNDRVPCL